MRRHKLAKVFLQVTSWLCGHESKGVEKHIENKSKNTVVCELVVGYIGLDLEERSRKGTHLGLVSIEIVFKIMIVEKVKSWQM